MYKMDNCSTIIFEGEPCMYIYLGGEKVIRSDELIAILHVAEDQEVTMDHIENVDNKPPKALVITKHKMYYSSISATTLARRFYRNG